jgi:DNA invertase Pin-like site-specific DNA recombinase
MTAETEVRKPIITKIPKRVTRGNSVNMLTPQAKTRAAAYARVSSDKDSQEESFQGQCDYYTNFIQKNPDWEFVELYADEAKSGLMTKKRDGFNRMVEDALAGKIDMIVTKSLSRFARNTTDTLNTVRKLTAIGVVFYFEKENIRTDNSTGEVLITILSSLAQEESNSISRNIKLGLQHRMESGKLGVNCGHLYGYEKSEDGKPQIIETEAAVVRRIYEMCLNGYSICKIAKILTDEGIEPPGKGKKWYDVTVKSILHNERYIGDLLCQKTVVPNYLTKEIVRNDNHEAQFYLEDSHIPIIDKDTYKRVQGILGDNKVGKRSPKLFAKRIICGDCGDLFTSVIWHCGHHAYQKEKWRCSGKYKKENHSKCITPAVDDELLQMVFVEAFNIKMCSITSNMEMAKMLGNACNNVFSTTEVENEIAELDVRMEQLDAEIRALLSDHTAIGLDKLSAEYAAAQAKIAELTEERERCRSNKIEADKFTVEVSKRTGLLTAFDENLFREVADCFIVNADGSVAVRFRDGSEVVVRKEAITE